jgi:hypothetical protein
VYKSHQRSQQDNHLIESFSQGSRDLGQMSRLLKGRQEPWIGEPAEEVPSFDETELLGFEILQDSRILDLRGWKPVQSDASDPGSLVFVYRRLKIFKQPENAPTQLLQPKLAMSRVQGSRPGQKDYHWRASYDFQHVPAGEFVDLIVEYHSPGRYLQRGANGTALVFPIRVDTAELTTWILMPEGREYQSFRIVRYEMGKPENMEAVKVVTEYLAEDFTIIAFKLLSLESGQTYEVSWTYR